MVVEPLIQKPCWSKWTFFLSRSQALQNIAYWPQKSIPSIVFQTRKYKLRGDTGHISIPGSSSSRYIWNQPPSCQDIREIDPWFQIYRELDEGICLKQIQRVVFLFKEIDMCIYGYIYIYLCVLVSILTSDIETDIFKHQQSTPFRFPKARKYLKATQIYNSTKNPHFSPKKTVESSILIYLIWCLPG